MHTSHKMNISGAAMMQQAQQIWSMLDDMANNDPQAYRKFIDKQMQEAKALRKPPEPHMCIQTTNLNSQTVFYINVCSWHKVPAPKSDQSPIPVTGGLLYRDLVNQEECDMLTIAFNESVLQEFGIDSTAQEESQMLMTLAFNYIEDQYGVSLSRSYVTFPKSQPYKGSKNALERNFLHKYSAQDKQFENELTEMEKSFGPLAEGCKDTLLSKLSNLADDDKVDVKPTDSSNESLLSKLSNVSISDTNKLIKNTTEKRLIEPIYNEPPLSAEAKSESTINELQINYDCQTQPILEEPEYTISVEETSNVRSMIICIFLPEVDSVADCELLISQYEACLEVPGLYKLKLDLPEKGDEDNAQAKFKRKSHQLIITIPIIK